MERRATENNEEGMWQLHKTPQDFQEETDRGPGASAYEQEEASSRVQEETRRAQTTNGQRNAGVIQKRETIVEPEAGESVVPRAI